MSNDGECDVFANYDSSNVHEHFKEVMVPLLADIKDVVDKDGSAIVAIENIKDLTNTQNKSNVWAYWLLKSVSWNEANLEVDVNHLEHGINIVTFKNADEYYEIPVSISRVTGYDVHSEMVEKRFKNMRDSRRERRRKEDEDVDSHIIKFISETVDDDYKIIRKYHKRNKNVDSNVIKFADEIISSGYKVKRNINNCKVKFTNEIVSDSRKIKEYSVIYQYFESMIIPFFGSIKRIVNKDGSAFVTIKNIKYITNTKDMTDDLVYQLLKSISRDKANLIVRKTRTSGGVAIIIFINDSSVNFTNKPNRSIVTIGKYRETT